jgi:hypothetical protein
MDYVALFFAGALLCNAIPHLVSGLCGAPFPSPFAKPSGIGDSSPLVNFLWGAGNFIVGGWLLAAHPITVGLNPRCAVLILGALLLGSFCARHFGRVLRDRRSV